MEHTRLGGTEKINKFNLKKKALWHYNGWYIHSWYIPAPPHILVTMWGCYGIDGEGAGWCGTVMDLWPRRLIQQVLVPVESSGTLTLPSGTGEKCLERFSE